MLLIDNYFTRIRTFLSILFQVLTATGEGNKIIGAEGEVHWVDLTKEERRNLVGVYPHGERLYFSISPEPVAAIFDDYGIPDDEVFHYFMGVREILKHSLMAHAEGWRIASCHLVSAKEELLD